MEEQKQKLDPGQYESCLKFFEDIRTTGGRLRVFWGLFKIVKVRDGKVVLKCVKDKR